MRPSITLCIIAKNEETNLPILLKSVEGCFDEIHVTDTGSVDNTVAIAERAGCKVTNYTWCDDFSAARNFSIKDVKTDYWMWLDCDDVLSSKEAFIGFRDNVMSMCDVWMANYNYAFANGRPVCTFARERIFKTSKKYSWKYPIHEGVLVGGSVNAVGTWHVDHGRTADDLKKDFGRNLRVFEAHKDTFDDRMQYYYGKELFESGRNKEAVRELAKAVQLEGLEQHDRVLCHQYLCFALMKEEKFVESIQFAQLGLISDPNRAEFYNILGDCYIKLGNLRAAVPNYSAAKGCLFAQENAFSFNAIFSHEDAYKTYPRQQLVRVYANMGMYDEAEEEAQTSYDKYSDELSKSLLAAIKNMKTMALIKPKKELEEVSDIVITTPPGGMYEWDEDAYKTYGIGGSETAAVELASNLAKITGNKVIIFNSRKEAKTFGNVEYRDVSQVNSYFSQYYPRAHIAWRHNQKLTSAPTYAWSHDLIIPGAQMSDFYKQALCLSNFHKDFFHSSLGVPKDKITVFRNGIEPKRFEGIKDVKKQYGKVVFSSSPDRGLDVAMRVMDEVIKKVPEAELHVFYGFDNMKKLGMDQEVARYEMMIRSRDYVKFHGNMPQKELTKQISDAQVWLYPTNFLETYCITAVEMALSNVYPVVRNYGALPDTLKDIPSTILDAPIDSSEGIKAYAEAVVAAITENYCDKMNVEANKYSWESVAQEFLRIIDV